MTLRISIIIAFLLIITESIFAHSPYLFMPNIGASFSNIGTVNSEKYLTLFADYNGGNLNKFMERSGFIPRWSFLHVEGGFSTLDNKKYNFLYRLTFMDVDLVAFSDSFMFSPSFGTTILDLNRCGIFNFDNVFVQLRPSLAILLMNNDITKIVSYNAIKFGYTGINPGEERFKLLGKRAAESYFGLEIGFNSGLSFNLGDYLVLHSDITGRYLSFTDEIAILEGCSELQYYFCKSENKIAENLTRYRVSLRYDYKQVYISEATESNVALSLGFNYFIGK